MASPPSPAPTTTALTAGASSPSAAVDGAPAAHVATRSCAITVPTASAARSARAAIRNGRASPAARGAEREALRGVDAVAQAARRDHRQPGRRGSQRRGQRLPRSATPQPANAAATAPARESRRPSISAQFVPPAPATSTAATPAPASARTSSRSSPKPTSLTTTGRGASRADDRRDPVEHAGERRLALGLDGLLHGVEVDRQAVGVEQLDEPLGPLRRARPAHLGGAEVGEQQRRPRPAGRAVGRQQRRVVEQRAARAEHEPDPVLGGGEREPRG